VPTRSHTRCLAGTIVALTLVACGDASVGGPGRATLLRAASSTRQTGLVAELVPSAPAVIVTDPDGAPLPGITVDFEVTAGGGSVTPASGVSGANGRVQTTWRLGTAGAQQVRASSPGVPGASVVFSADAVEAGAGYHIDLRLLSDATDSQWAAFQSAAARIEEVVVGELPAVDVTGRSCRGTAVTGTVQGVLILVDLEPIDGRGGILGEAGPCLMRSNGLPLVGTMRFDTEDLASLEAGGRLVSTIRHEMLHVVGFGIWNAPLLQGEGGANPVFTGTAALDAAIHFNGAPASWTSVPVENCGPESPPGCGGGTRDAHWREPIFTNELMTGWLSGSSQPLSRTTIAALADMGYVVNLDAADPFDLGLAGLRSADPFAPEPIPLGDDVLHLPIEIVP
jgi:hypothetical protein